MIQKLDSSEAKLKNGPGSMEASRFSGGSVQAVGTQAPLKPSPAGLGLNRNTGNGAIQAVGSQADLNRTPRKGMHGNASIPMSKRAVEQSR
jgi:hypothetical protein